MPDLVPLLVAIGSIIGGVAAILRGLPKLRRLFRVDQTDLVASLRELADTREEQLVIVRGERDDERRSHLDTKVLLSACREALRDEQLAGDRCRRELDNVQSELRGIGRRRESGGSTP